MTMGPALFAFDGSDGAERALRQAAVLLSARPAVVACAWSPVATLDPLDPVGAGLARVLPMARELDALGAARAREHAERGTAILGELGLEARAAVLDAAAGIGRALLALGRELDASVLVLGRRRAGGTGALLGSVSHGVVQRTDRPVLLAGAEPPTGTIVLGYDGSEAAREAVLEAARLLAPRHAVVAHVWHPLSHVLLWNPLVKGPGPLAEPAAELDAAGRDAALRLAEEGAQLARAAGMEAEPLVLPAHDRAWRMLMDVADERDAGVVVVGGHGLPSVVSSIVGCVAAGIAHHCLRPVLIVPLPAVDPVQEQPVGDHADERR